VTGFEPEADLKRKEAAKLASSVRESRVFLKRSNKKNCWDADDENDYLIVRIYLSES